MGRIHITINRGAPFLSPLWGGRFQVSGFRVQGSQQTYPAGREYYLSRWERSASVTSRVRASYPAARKPSPEILKDDFDLSRWERYSSGFASSDH
jgi:hypothetical protein